MSTHDEKARPRFALAAVDIDDTLVGADGVVSAANVAAVARLVADGTRIVLASGRSHGNMVPFHRALGLSPGPVISAQGAVVRDSDTDEVRFAYPIALNEVATVTREGRERGFTVQHYRATGIYIEGRSRWSEYDQSRNAEPHRQVDDLLATSDGKEVPFDVAKIIWLGDPAVVTSVTPDVHARYDARLTVTRTDPPYLEFSPPNVSKATALAAVAAELGVEQRRVLAFGDGNNDAAMLAWAGVGVAMPHARESARTAADVIGPDGDAETAFARAVAMVLDESSTEGVPLK
ncbi:MAG: Cof-type HAD-IIB family hydrolase [bacterium]